jgi:p-cumate 2,3-dioxygenase beta subunit
MNKPLDPAATVTRAEVEDFLYHEADLLDNWRLDDWLSLLTDSAEYYVPPNDKPDGDHRFTLFTVADDIVRLRERVIRLKDPNCHAEYPPSRTRRLITNVRITGMDGDLILVAANFAIFRHRRNEAVPRQFIGRYRYKLKRTDAGLKIQERRAILDAEELGAMGAVSFLL